MMGSKRSEKRISSMNEFINQFTPETLDEYYNSFRTERPTPEKSFKTNQKKNSNKSDFWTDSDDEFKSELENAVKQYRKNIVKSKPLLAEPTLPKKEIQHETKENQIINMLDNLIYSKKDIKEDVNTNGNSSTDVQDLINYFFLKNKDKREKSIVKSYSDYEKQGAIPKYKFPVGNSSDRSKNTQVESKSNKNKKGNNQQKIPKNSQSTLNEDVTDNKKNSDCFKISEEFCSEPFYYVVPENPRPNFFLSPGSYYVVPKTPPTAFESRVFFHPENQTERHPISNESETGILVNEKKHSRTPINNLGKEVPQKLDSHLNIGPVDVKSNDSNNNLETNYNSNKIFNKSLLNSNSSDGLKRVQEGVGIYKKNIDSLNDILIESETEIISEEVSEAEVLRIRELDKTLQKLLSELPNLDANSAKIIADKYVMDEEGLKNYIASAQLAQKIQQQLERMVLALPEHSYDELREKCSEFQGEEELVSGFILEAQQAKKINQQILDLQFVLPDADSEFLRQEIEKLHGDDNAFNILTDRLLEDKNYPKIHEDPLSAERRRWWQMYVENFNIKNFLLNYSGLSNFSGSTSKTNKKDDELKIKFLELRYPSKTRDFLMTALHSNNFDLRKTCDSLKGVESIRLSRSSFKNEAFSEAFLKQICYIDHEEEIEDYLKEEKERKEIEAEEAWINNSFLHCPLCSEDELIASEAICCLDGHIFCKDCIKRYIFVKISDGVFKFACPLEHCDTSFSYKALQEILSEDILSSIINKQQAEEISTAHVEGLESCPYCEFAYIPNPEDKIFKCQNPNCLIETCRNCQEKSHIPLRCEEIERPKDLEARKKIEESMTQELVRICPKCQKKFVKIDGCNKMICICGTIVCYICRKEVSGYDHFSRYSGDGKCPLHTNNEALHTIVVYQAGIRTREEILRENQDIRIVHDPTIEK